MQTSRQVSLSNAWTVVRFIGRIVSRSSAVAWGRPRRSVSPLVSDSMCLAIFTTLFLGVALRVIGSLKGTSERLVAARTPSSMRVHVRAIVRDGSRAFVGIQSLRRLELEARREAHWKEAGPERDVKADVAEADKEKVSVDAAIAS